jgi:hypothetical protein
MGAATRRVPVVVVVMVVVVVVVVVAQAETGAAVDHLGTA